MPTLWRHKTAIRVWPWRRRNLRRNRPTTDPRHREALLVVPRDCILEEAMAENWRAVAALTRCNVATICKGAQHGWIGASFSCLDILICLHQRMSDAFDSVVLAKGHAAAAQYAVLYSTGEMSAEMLRQYKNGKDTPEAHADILCDTGSLGQCLSTVAGMASAAPHKHFGVVLGDGELQEGQNFEALMSIRHHNIANLTIIVDRNGFQSDNRTKDIMPIHDLPRVLEGFGFTVLHVPDGHDPETLRESILQTIPNSGGSLGKSDGDRPNLYVIIADTSKAAPPLTSHMMPSVHPETGLLHQPWHTKVPTWDVYIAVVEEQLAMAQSASASARWSEHKASQRLADPGVLGQLPNSHRPSYPGALGTGKVFGHELVRIIKTRQDESDGFDLRVVSCDLATSCGINGIVGCDGKFFELGVAEQDAASFSGNGWRAEAKSFLCSAPTAIS